MPNLTTEQLVLSLFAPADICANNHHGNTRSAEAHDADVYAIRVVS